MSRHYDRLIADATLTGKGPPKRTVPMNRTEIENLIRATVLPGGHRISDAAVRRITDAWDADTTLVARIAYDNGYHDGVDIYDRTPEERRRAYE